MITFGSVCSGIEAASVAWEPLGWKAAWLSEIEPFPCALLKHHYPDVPNLGDMTKIAHLIRDGFVPAPDVFCGGTPCQAFSVAGLRNSLDDARGNLTLTFCEIANEIDARRAATGLLPAIVFWENVPGVLSTKDNAFGCFLGALAGEDCPLEPPGGKWANAGCVFGPQRTVAWRVTDAQYFGVAQRRRRVFVVASARKGFDPTEVLFEFDGVRRDTPPSREAGQDTAGTLASRTDGGGFPGTDEACSGYVQPVAFGGNNQSGPIEVATARNACSSASGRMDFESETFLVQPVSGTLQANGKAAGSATQQDADSGMLVPIAYSIRTANTSSNGWGIQEEVTHTLDSTAGPAVCVTGDITHTLKAEGFDASEDGTGRGQPIVAAFAENSRAELRYEGGDGARTGALTSGGGKPGQGAPMAQIGMAVRRLTPVECERLQSFPDGYTFIPTWNGWRPMDASETPENCIAEGLEVRQNTKTGKWRVKDVDGPRYKALGNSWCVYNARLIGERINKAMLGLMENSV